MITVESSSCRAKLGASAGASIVASTLLADPHRRILVPVVARIGDLTQSGFDIVPALFVVKSATDEFSDERAPAAYAGSLVQLGNKIVVQRYVHTHGLRLAHSGWRSNQTI